MAPLMYETISEEEFFKYLEQESVDFLKIGALLQPADNQKSVTKSVSLYNHITSVSDSLENFLDDYGANENKTFRSLRELVASVRNFSSITQVTSHVLGRLGAYKLDGTYCSVLQNDLIDASGFFAKCTTDLYLESIAALGRLGIHCEPELSEKAPVPYAPDKRLPFTVELTKSNKGEGHITQIAIYYKDVLTRSKDIISSHKLEEDLGNIADNWINEGEAEKLKSKMKRIESYYDTHIKGTKIESEDKKVAQFRGIAASSSHMFAIAEGLLHFYERHEGENRPDESGIANIVDKNQVLFYAINIAWKHADQILQHGAEIAEYICEKYAGFSQYELILTAPMHARPVALLCKLGEHYAKQGIEMQMKDGMFYKIHKGSMLTVLSQANNTGQKVQFRAPQKVLDDVILLNELRFGEGRKEKFPQALDYLN